MSVVTKLAVVIPSKQLPILAIPPAHYRRIACVPDEVVVVDGRLVPGAAHASSPFRGAAEDVVADNEVRRCREVPVVQEVRAVPVRTLRMRPAAAGVDARIMFEYDVLRLFPVPVLEGILRVPDHVVAPDDVRFGVVVALVRESRVVYFPKTVALNDVSCRIAPELDAVAEADGVQDLARLFVLFPALESSADPADVAVADRDVARLATAKAVRPAVADPKSVIDDVVPAPLAND